MNTKMNDDIDMEGEEEIQEKEKPKVSYICGGIILN